MKIETIPVDQIMIGLESTYYRFDTGLWYKLSNDGTLIPVEDTDRFDKLYYEHRNK